jgi:hypothetical protein
VELGNSVGKPGTDRGHTKVTHQFVTVLADFLGRT